MEGNKIRHYATLCLFVILLAASCIRPVAPTPTPAELVTPTPAPIPTLPPTGAAGFPWWNETIFYEIFVRSFYDSNGDGIGDLNGLIAKLDYLNDGNPQTHADLGITGLWLMPIHPSPSYHGYDVTDYYTVNPDYGTADDFRRLMEEAHKRGIRVISDFVMNHTSNKHPWFVQAQDPQSPYHDWYRWSESDPGGTGPWGQQVWYQTPSGDYYYAVFAKDKPDLNYANPAVREEMKNVARFWLEEMGVDGFRVDGARYLVEEEIGSKKVLADSEGNHAWYREFRTFYKGVNPNAITVGEIWTTNDTVAPYLQGDEFDLAFNFDLASAIVTSARNGEADAARISQAISLKLLPQNATATFLTNHDQNRLFSELGGDVDKAKRAATLLLTSAGTPFLYYGEEIGLAGEKPDEDLRLPMHWSDSANAGFSTGARGVRLILTIRIIMLLPNLPIQTHFSLTIAHLSPCAKPMQPCALAKLSRSKAPTAQFSPICAPTMTKFS